MTKGSTLEKIWKALPSDRKRRIKAKTAQLAATYLTLQEMKKLIGLTQATICDRLGMPQSNLSRLEKSSDMLLSTLRQYVEATGGTLTLTVELPGQDPIILNGLSDLIDPTHQNTHH
ncbi:MAG: XRE family transcriptional regulator [Pseudomonadota bacterium]